MISWLPCSTQTTWFDNSIPGCFPRHAWYLQHCRRITTKTQSLYKTQTPSCPRAIVPWSSSVPCLLHCQAFAFCFLHRCFLHRGKQKLTFHWSNNHAMASRGHAATEKLYYYSTRHAKGWDEQSGQENGMRFTHVPSLLFVQSSSKANCHAERPVIKAANDRQEIRALLCNHPLKPCLVSIDENFTVVANREHPATK